ncbi:hypothetical protein F5B22DRAFT_92066 [Xylaria bambusicola]|uniref:uncharacterized protein n=1 Tax=Xylaria bambusicola TaxID=326684 RepID=UPI0020082850|nr:uncharacterized protein F5B22DRAFT_92066 [Xylaria bambusicola]KAI0518098.1 hypothetical protein F5B22DRAFT_92066 [Xylaria bambusicola]
MKSSIEPAVKMGSTATESAGIPTSRQKNCNACVQAKRRCDRRTPVCSRCVQKTLPCVYTKSRPTHRLGENTREPTPLPEALPLQSPAYSPLNIPGVSFDMDYTENMSSGFLPDVAIESTPESHNSDVPYGNTAMGSFLDFIGYNAFSSSDQWLVRNEDEHLPERPPTPADEELLAVQSNMAACSQLDSWHVYDPKSPLYYILNRVKRFTTEMAEKNTTPFIHRYLYHEHKPRCIMSCFTTCVLYANRTPNNTAMVMKALSDSARELVDSEAYRVVPTPIEKLARSQTLFLYQIIRLFDGDITLRAQGEKDIGLLKTWLGELCRIRDNLGDLALLEGALVKDQSPAEWENWIFAECVRRTIIMAYAVIGLYELLKDQRYTDPDDPWAYVHRWTLGRSLWEAGSPTEFQRAWRENSHFIIASFLLGGFVENGKGEDVDEFTEIFLNVYMGGDATKEFIDRRK